jgi:8-oxo-dGTP diphosphatase
VDVVLLSIREGQLHTLLLQRKEPPCQGFWALPGGFIHMDESLEGAAARVLAAKTGLEGVFLEQLYTFGAPGRDPRTRVVSVAHYALVDAHRFQSVDLQAQGLALARIEVPWAGEKGGPVRVRSVTDKEQELDLAFDHSAMLTLVVQRLRGKLDYSPVAFQLLPERFTLHQLQKVHETILGRTLNKDSFRKRLLATGLLVPTGEVQQDVDHRPAALYCYARTLLSQQV